MAEQLAADHLGELAARYVALVRRLEFAATLAHGDGPALDALARSLVAPVGSGAASSSLTTADGNVLAEAGGAKPGESPLRAWQSMRGDERRAAACVGSDTHASFAPCAFGAELRAQATVQELGGVAHALALVPVSSDGRRVGVVVASEVLAGALDGWSERVGARIAAGGARRRARRWAGARRACLPRSSSCAPPPRSDPSMRRSPPRGATAPLAGLVALAIALYRREALVARLPGADRRDPRVPSRQAAATSTCGCARGAATRSATSRARSTPRSTARAAASSGLRNVQSIAHFGDWSADLEHGRRSRARPSSRRVLGLPVPGSREGRSRDFIHCLSRARTATSSRTA
jgi:hypothetical protein